MKSRNGTKCAYKVGGSLDVDVSETVVFVQLVCLAVRAVVGFGGLSSNRNNYLQYS